MATTSRTGWTVDALTDLADGPAMIKELGDQVGNEIGLPAYTSTTRPSTGNYGGREIYETDTGRIMRYPDAGTTWEVQSARLWQTYTTQWTDGPAGANLSIGTGTLEGFYFQVGEMVTYQVRMNRAAPPDSNTGSGTNAWTFSLPVTPDSYIQPLGFGQFNRGSSFLNLQVAGIGGTSIVLIIPSGGTTGSFGTRLSAAVPGSYVAGDALYFGGTYRALTAV